MAKPITIPNTFAAATSAIPLSQLDQDFSTLANSTNDLATYSNYVADTGAANAFIANYPVNTNTASLTTGLRLQFKAANANTGASTLNVQVNGGSIGTAAIRLTDGSALPANTIIAGAMVDVMYDGTNFQLMNDPSGGQEVITNLTLSGNLTVTGTSNFTGNVTANVANTTTSTITNLSSGNVTITGGTISNVTLDNVTVDVETFSNITINGTATFAAGTVSAPSITTSGDTNTGIYFPAADTIAFTEGGVEAMRIDSSGNVQIGTTTTATSATALTLYKAGGVELFLQNSTTGTGSNGFRLLANGNDAYLTNKEAGVMIFETSDTERMRITSGGAVLIGRTTNPSSETFSVNGNASNFTTSSSSDGTTGWYGVNLNGAVGAINISRNGSNVMAFFHTSNANALSGSPVGTISITTTATTYSTSSDYRLKENIAPMTSALDKVAQLKPCTYTWKSNGLAGQGFIAHELQSVIPDAVVGEKDAVDEDGKPIYQGVDTSFLVATLTSAIQELHEIVKAQAAEIALLKSK